MRKFNRSNQQLRQASIKRAINKHAEGSALIELGDTKIICTASIEEKVPHFLRGKNSGWITAEYSMLPRATGERNHREASKGRQSGRTLEIQRLIGRSLRAVVDLSLLGEFSILIDCDVLQADGGTRTASITGAFVALFDAIKWLENAGKINKNPLTGQLAAVSVGLKNQQVLLDLDYEEDSQIDIDMNVVMDNQGRLIEIQASAENASFSECQLREMLSVAKIGIFQLFELQKQVLAVL